MSGQFPDIRFPCVVENFEITRHDTGETIRYGRGVITVSDASLHRPLSDYTPDELKAIAAAWDRLTADYPKVPADWFERDIEGGIKSHDDWR